MKVTTAPPQKEEPIRTRSTANISDRSAKKTTGMSSVPVFYRTQLNLIRL